MPEKKRQAIWKILQYLITPDSLVVHALMINKEKDTSHATKTSSVSEKSLLNSIQHACSRVLFRIDVSRPILKRVLKERKTNSLSYRRIFFPSVLAFDYSVFFRHRITTKKKRVQLFIK